ncbi:MAG TPA: response regulator transcription factor [Spirochaetota bacterium]|nr:response regulator transcription factor [Spirochaetota bacterium]HOM87698.1 response regulator transcription factor [Spirochaetota bacterium]HOR92965.1 response regulator transcription factor [Spirochaetota bacterium]HOT19335.1 response regulator transcription factor [Spirochaetota bacterium]HPD05272.1 response regulator transcription factor [Spirochaetota bacterium]
MSKIYVVDDEKDIREILKVNLQKNGYDVNTFASAEEVLKQLAIAKPDLFILDIMMNGMDGLDLCKHIRASRELTTIPILFLSAKSAELDKVLGLELGADDYLTKPFSIHELIARVKAIMRRSQTKQELSPKEILTYNAISLYPDKFQVTIDNQNIDLTKTEFLILKLFMQYPGKIFSRDNIIDSIRGDNVYVIDRTIDVHIMNLRKKLGTYKDAIKTYSGVGYGLKV